VGWFGSEAMRHVITDVVAANAAVCVTVIKVDVVNSSQPADDQLTFLGHRQRTADDAQDTWTQSLGFIRLSGSNLINPSSPTGNVT